MWGLILVIDPDIFSRSDDTDQTGLVELEDRFGKGHFNGNGTGGLANQNICQRQGQAIGGTGSGHPEMPVSGEGGTLQGGLQPAFQDSQAHSPAACGQLSNVSREIDSKRTACPADSSAGWAFAGSNRRSGVRPMIGQPPGLSKE